MKFRAIYELHEIEEKYTIIALCTFLKVTPQGYNNFKKRLKTIQDQPNIDEILVFDKWIEFNKSIGYKKISLQLLWDYGIIMNHKKVYRIMKKLKIRAIQRKKTYRAQVNRETKHEYVYPNRLQGNFLAKRRYEKLCTDITEFSIRGEKVYLSAVIDLYDNQIVTYKRSRGDTGRLVIDTLRSLDKSKIKDTIYHSDRGGEYTAYAYKRLLEKNKIKGSMSKAKTPSDNAPIEVFHSMIKTEIQFNNIKSIEELEQKIDDYIYIYNYRRVQHKLKTPPVYYR